MRRKLARLIIVLAGIVLGQVVLYGPSLAGRKILLPLDYLARPGVLLPPTPEIIARIEAENEVARKREARAVQADEVCRLENVGAIVAALGLAAKKLKT